MIGPDSTSPESHRIDLKETNLFGNTHDSSSNRSRKRKNEILELENRAGKGREVALTEYGIDPKYCSCEDRSRGPPRMLCRCRYGGRRFSGREVWVWAVGGHPPASAQ